MTEPMFFADAKAFGQWLKANAGSATELLVGFYKVGTERPSMSWSESVDKALCVGWIDGVRKRIDETAYSIRFTPRKPTSIWSAINMAKFKQLQVAGRMTPAGVQAFALRTEARYRVYAYEQGQSANLSATEVQAFERNKVAWAFFESAPSGYKKVVLHWVSSAKRLETRATRFAKLVDACSARQRL